MTLFEEARLNYFGKGLLNLLSEDLIFPFVLLKTDIRFVKPGKGGVNVIVDIRTTQLGSSSFTQQYRVRWADNGEIWSEAEAVLVCFDFDKNSKMNIPENFKSSIQRLEGLPTSTAGAAQQPAVKVQFESNYDENKDKIAIGMYAQVKKRFGMAEVQQFASLSEDYNPLHLDETFAKTTRFGRPIVHGQLYTSLISALAGIKLPGKGTVYVSQLTKFRAPVFVGDEVIARVQVTAIDTTKNLVTLETTCKSIEGKLLMTGEAVLMVPSEKLTVTTRSKL